MGVPLRPVVIVRKMSSTAGPDLNWPLVRSAGTVANPRSSLRPAAFSPSPLPPWPWHSQHFATCQTSLPRSSIVWDGVGGRPIDNRGAGGCAAEKDQVLGGEGAA